MKKITSITLFLLLVNVACRKENALDNPAPASSRGDTLTLNSAKQWYQNAERKIRSSGNTSSIDHGKWDPEWIKASSHQKASGNYWLIPLKGQAKMSGYRAGYRKLAFYRLASGEISAYIFEIVPDLLSLQKGEHAGLDHFTGRVFVYDLDYHLISGIVLANGKATGEIRRTPKGTKNNSLTTNLVRVIETCTWYQSSYTNAEGELVIYSEKICSYTTVQDNPPSLPDGFGSVPVTGGGGGGNLPPATPPPPTSNLPGEKGTKVKPNELMNCFDNIPDAGATMKVTVYVQEPFPGTEFNIGPNSVGHTAIGLTKSNGSSSVTQVLGYYPSTTRAAFGGSSKIVNNGGDLNFDVSITYTINAASFKKIMNYIANPPSTYDMLKFNCTTFVDIACLKGGIDLPSSFNFVGPSGPGGSPMVMCPAGLGKSIREQNTNNVNKKGGTTPNSNGPCNKAA
ncbi:hypothetical protein [Mucilaginibacter gynuensis]